MPRHAARRFALFATIALLGAPGPGSAQVHGPAGSPVPDVRTSESPPSAEAVEFARKAGIGNRFEIESSRLALERARDPQVRAFAQTMVSDHGRLAAQMQQTVQPPNQGVPLPPALDPPHAAKLAQLRKAEGDAFDRLYLQMQRQAHEDALALHRAYAADGGHAGLRSLAETAAPIVEEHLGRVRVLADRAGGRR